MNIEIPLPGGQRTPGVVRIDNTVRRPLSEGWEFRHALLRHLETVGFPFSPRILGVDEQQREILTYLEGETMVGGEVSLREIGAMIAAFHSATAGTTLAGSHELVCHRDIAPWNTIHQHGHLVGMIDFDAAEPGNHLDDLAYAAWTFLNIGSVPQADVVTGLQKITGGYGLVDRTGLAEAILQQQSRVLSWRKELAASASDPRLRKFSRERTHLIRQQMAWVEQHQQLLDGTESRKKLSPRTSGT